MSTGLAPAGVRRSVLLRVSGVVQGVGFRPFVHRLAARWQLDGWVRNELGEVLIALEGASDALDAFVAALRTDAPPLARIDALHVTPRIPGDLHGFHIAASADGAAGRQAVSPDVAMCADCEREFRDPFDRRYRYAFITCTNCGPRHSVIDAMPYDRERTTMRQFTQCPACRREYESFDDRRYHSETNSCPVCGPTLRFLHPEQGIDERDAGTAIAAAGTVLRSGGIVAVRGIGGFHLACDATDESAVRRLRERKHRDGKPLAIMVLTVDEARALAVVSEAEEQWLQSTEHPIVVLALRDGTQPIARAVSNGLTTVGVMLAYAPLQHLLLEAAGRPLVMTSGNTSRQPLEVALDEARRSLGGIADAFLTHDRDIVARIDDSVLRVDRRSPVLLRRARGFAPLPVPIPIAAPVPLLAVGGHLKNTFALANAGDVWVSQHIGDLETIETAAHWADTLAAFRRFYRLTPAAVARDLHPEYLSTSLAAEQGIATVIGVQHHHAHIAAVAAEHGVTAPVVGLAFDGTGYGEDGRIWGAECLVADLEGYRRVGQLRYAPLPGGDAGARSPWRAALGYLSLEGSLDEPSFAEAFAGVSHRELRLAWQQCERRLNAPEASSMGRLFDAAAAVLGVCTANRFEGEAAMRLESLAGSLEAVAVPMPVLPDGDGVRIIDPVPLLVELGDRRACGEEVGRLAAVFHESVAEAAADLAARVAAAEELNIVALGGGVFQNVRLLRSIRDRLEAQGLTVLAARLLPPNDGGLSYGQAAVAAARLSRGQTP